MKLRWILAGIFLIGAAYFALFGGDYGYFEVRRLSRERAVEEARLEATRAGVTRMRGRADSLKRDSATLERLAREKYGFIRKGERLYRFVDSAKAPPRPAPRDSARY